MLRFKFVASLCVPVILAGYPVRAIEPDAPERLITQTEALNFGVRLWLDRNRTPKDRFARRDRIALASFYATNGRSLLWVTSSGLTDRARRLAKEIRKADQWGLSASDFELPKAGNTVFNNAKLVKTELQMSLALIKYARHARGGRMDPKRISKDFDLTPAPLNVETFFQELLASDDPEQLLRRQHPPHWQFEKLRQAYLAALKSEAAGDSVLATRSIRQSRLKSRRKNITPKGRVSSRILYNMEMWRWMPRALGSKYIQANIPEFKVRVIDRWTRSA